MKKLVVVDIHLKYALYAIKKVLFCLPRRYLRSILCCQTFYSKDSIECVYVATSDERRNLRKRCFYILRMYEQLVCSLSSNEKMLHYLLNYQFFSSSRRSFFLSCRFLLSVQVLIEQTNYPMEFFHLLTAQFIRLCCISLKGFYHT